MELSVFPMCNEAVSVQLQINDYLSQGISPIVMDYLGGIKKIYLYPARSILIPTPERFSDTPVAVRIIGNPYAFALRHELFDHPDNSMRIFFATQNYYNCLFPSIVQMDCVMHALNQIAQEFDNSKENHKGLTLIQLHHKVITHIMCKKFIKDGHGAQKTVVDPNA